MGKLNFTSFLCTWRQFDKQKSNFFVYFPFFFSDDDKHHRRDRFHSGITSDFKDKDNYKPNVKLEYIDDSGRLLNEKEAFRYLSHKFHGKGPGKNKIEKRLKKSEQETVSIGCIFKFFPNIFHRFLSI